MLSRLLCLFLCNDGQTRVVTKRFILLGGRRSLTKTDGVQKECNAAWDQLKKNNPTGEGLTEATNKNIEELRRKKNGTKN